MSVKFKKTSLKRLIKELFKLKLTTSLRLKILFLGVAGLFVIAAGYLTYIVVLGLSHNFGYNLISSNKNLTLRHDIIDRNGSVLAVTVPSSSIYLRPKDVLNKDLAIKAITNVFNINKAMASNMVNSEAPFVWVARNVSNNTLNKFLQFGVIGAYIDKGYMRFYPYGNYFSHIVGVTNIDGNGISGVEYSFNNELLKRSVQLSLDVRMQVILREALVKAVKRNSAKRAFGIIVNPKNGEVLALSSVPDFNPNNRDNLALGDMFNYVTQGVFEQGSTFKLFTIAMAIDSGDFKISDNFDVSKPIVKHGYVLVDDTYINGSINLPQILMYSSDIGSALIARQLNVDMQKRYFSYMGLFNATSLEIPEKEDSVLPRNWSELTRITLSYGYGMAVSQATAANAFMTLINGGYYVPLTLIKRNENAKLQKYQVFKAETSTLMQRMGRLVVAEGTGKAADVKGYDVGGKTGTAELIDKKRGGYNMSKVLASVLAYFPASDPQYLILMSVEEPKRSKDNMWSRVAARTIAPEAQEVISNIGALFALPKESDGADQINRNNQEQVLQFVNNDDHATTTTSNKS